MTNLKTAMVALGFLALSTQAVMAENKKEESYNYKRGVELLLEDDDMDRGLQFLNKEIADHKDNGYAHLWISRVYHRQGKYGQALDAACKAIKYLSKDTEKLAFAYYHRANIYDMLDEEEKMLNDLTMANKFDPDLERVRQLPEFEALLQEFEAKRESARKAESDGAEYEEELIEIPFTREGSLCMVKCTINGLPLHFCFDTGASDVGLSSVEAAFMLKNGYLDKSDFYGKSYFSNANGDISEGTNIRLREINFGGLVLKDIKASVAKSQKAPLLLGQTVLQRLGKIEIDNERKVLKVTRTVKK